MPGIDALFIGPNDLSFSMGHSGDQKHAEVLGAIDSAIKKIARSKVAAGLMTVPLEDQRKYAVSVRVI